MHSRPALASASVYTLSSGAQVSILERQTVGGHAWLRVRSQDGRVSGWIADGPQYVIDRPMSIYSLGGTLTMLYPTTWAVQAGDPATFTAPSGDPDGGTLHLQSAPDATSLPSLPLAAGSEDTGQESSVDVDGIPSEIFVYLLSGGGTEYFIERRLGTLVYLIDLQQPQSTPDTTLFKQLLASVDAQFPTSPTPGPSPS